MKIIHIVILGVLGIGTGMYTQAMQRDMPWRRQPQQQQQSRRGDEESLLRAIRPATERIVGPAADPSRKPSQQSSRRVIIPAGPTAAEVAAQQAREAQEQQRRREIQGQAEEQRLRREKQEQELKEESERLQRSAQELEERRQRLLQRATQQGEAYEKIERALAERRKSMQRREEQRQEIERKEQEAFVARQGGVQRQLARFEDLLLLKAEQKKRLPGLLMKLMDPLFTALTVLNDKGARRNLRNIIKRLIKVVNKGRPASEGHIPQDYPDTNDLTPLLIQSINNSMQANQPLLESDDFAVVDLLQALHAGDLQQAIRIAQTAYRGSHSFGDDFTIEKFDREYKNTLAGIALMGMFEHGKPFEFLVREPRGNLQEQADAMMAEREQEKEKQYAQGLEAWSDDEEERAALQGF